MSGPRRNALRGVDPDRGRRERQNNIVAARNNAREERLNHRRRIADDGSGGMALTGANDSTNDIRRSLEDLPVQVRETQGTYVAYQLSLCVCRQLCVAKLLRPGMALPLSLSACWHAGWHAKATVLKQHTLQGAVSRICCISTSAAIASVHALHLSAALLAAQLTVHQLLNNA